MFGRRVLLQGSSGTVSRAALINASANKATSNYFMHNMVYSCCFHNLDDDENVWKDRED
jgi:hypothetical protein